MWSTVVNRNIRENSLTTVNSRCTLSVSYHYLTYSSTKLCVYVRVHSSLLPIAVFKIDLMALSQILNQYLLPPLYQIVNNEFLV